MSTWSISTGSLSTSQPNCFRNATRPLLSDAKRLYGPVDATAVSGVLEQDTALITISSISASMAAAVMMVRFDIFFVTNTRVSPHFVHNGTERALSLPFYEGVGSDYASVNKNGRKPSTVSDSLCTPRLLISSISP